MRVWRLLLFLGTFGIVLYMLNAIVRVMPVASMLTALSVAGFLVLADMLVHTLSRHLWQRRFENRAPTAPDLDRRRFMVSTVVPAAAVAVGGLGVAGSAAAFTVRREDVRLRHLPQELEGFRIGLITDPHIGVWTPPDRLARAVDALNDADVHVHCLGGDLIDDLSLLDATFAALERCRAPYGTFAVLGNHEKMGRQLPAILDAYQRQKAQSQIHLLVDAHVRIEHRGTPLWIAGVDYPMHPGGSMQLPPDEHQAFMHASAAQAFQGVDIDEPVVCLAHHPDCFRIAAARGAWLTLAGHTHGGQWAIFGHPLLRSFEFMRGRYRLGPAHLYVSTGLGDWLPCRIGVPTEVTVLTLKSAE